MEKLRGKTLKEWKDYCKSDNVPIKTMKYISCLEERIEALTIPVVVGQSEQLVCHDCKSTYTKVGAKFREYWCDCGGELAN
tara:strand:- start:563 stop:805 length:243 start_codon:yes stop_codon:yes gene_type:complete